MGALGPVSVKFPSAVASTALGGLAETHKERKARDVKTQRRALPFDLFKPRILHADAGGEMLRCGGRQDKAERDPAAEPGAVRG